MGTLEQLLYISQWYIDGYNWFFSALDYKSTATYYWSLIAENGYVSDSVTGFVDGENSQTKTVEPVAGPFGFDEAIKLGPKQVCFIWHIYRNYMFRNTNLEYR